MDKPITSYEPVTRLPLTAVFFDAIVGEQSDAAPLTPFMIHTARRAGVSDKELRDPKRREAFVYWFYDTLHRLRAPYNWPVSPAVIDWLNRPAIRCEDDSGYYRAACSLYLTRFMAHVWSSTQKGWNVRQHADCLRFLTWFAFECVPAWNLPPLLIPEDLMAALNEPVCGASIPLTAAMEMRVEIMHPGLADAADEAHRIAASFEATTDALRASDPRLLPPFVSSFWFDNAGLHASSTRYEYVAARTWYPESGTFEEPPPGDTGARNWFLHRYVPAVPAAGMFAHPDGITRPSSNVFDDQAAVSGRSAQAIILYRDQQTVCGTAYAGKMVMEALQRAPMPIFDIGFTLSRENIPQEFNANERQSCSAARALHVLCLNPEYIPECLASHVARIAETDYLIGHFYWELSDIGTAHQCALSLVDEIWVASEYLRELYARHTCAPVVVIGQAVDVERPAVGYSRASLGLPADAYLFLSTLDAGSVLERKNPLAALEAFQQAFPDGSENAGFVLKVRNTTALQTDRDRAHWTAVKQMVARDGRIRLLDETLPAPAIAALNEICDCYVSLHRSEGFGLGPAEALARGKPVISTAYSGTADFCTPETAWPVGYKLVEVEPGSYPYMDPGRGYYWAEPDITAAAVCMQELYLAPEEGRRRALRGKELMATKYTAAALERRCLGRLREIGFWPELL